MATLCTQQQIGWFEWEVYRLQRTSSALPASVKTVTAAYTMTDDDWYVFVNGSSGSTITISLPAPGPRAGHEYVIKRIGTDAVILSVSTGSIDGLSDFIIPSIGDTVSIISDGSQWRVYSNVLTPYPETQVRLYDDFLSLDGNTAGTNVVSSHAWRTAGATPGEDATDGHVRVDGDGSTQGNFFLGRTSTLNLIYASDCPVAEFRCRVAQRGTSAGTRRFGFGVTALTSDPADGVFFRHTNAGNYEAVVRESTSETAVDTGVAAANGVFHTFRIVLYGGAETYFYIDNALEATINSLTVVSPIRLGIGFAAGGTAANTGLTVDYVYYEGVRTS